MPRNEPTITCEILCAFNTTLALATNTRINPIIKGDCPPLTHNAANE